LEDLGDTNSPTFNINYIHSLLKTIKLGTKMFFAADAPWWEPGTPNFLDIGDVSAILVFLITLTGVFLAITKFWLKLLRRIIREEIEVATQPIHPSANGGLSLADVARKTNSLETQLSDIQKETKETKDLLIKVLAQSVVIPDTVPMAEPPVKRKSRKSSGS
jgi:hypothetical protein